MPDDSTPEKQQLDATQVAEQLVDKLVQAGCDYALGGALALGYWATPRSTIDVDVTLYLPPDKPHDCMRLLQLIGCTIDLPRTETTLTEHGYCQVMFAGRRLDVFLPLVPFYKTAARRRKKVPLGKREALIWDAESLCVFKMMFYRRKDLADVESILRTQGDRLDKQWTEQQLIEMYGHRDPRITSWRELLAEGNGT